MEKGTKKRLRKTLGSYPSITVVLSISLALFVLGLFGLLLIHTDKLTRIIKQNVEIQVYLNKNITDAQKTKIQKTLGSNEYILLERGEPWIVFVSKEQAAEEFIKATGEDFSKFLGDNPLRDLLRVKIRPGYQQLDSMKTITNSIKSMGGVYEVVYVESLVNSINTNIAKISIILVAFSIILILIVILLINNTIKLALYSQRFLIRSMQLVGATGTFIKKPFLARAMFYGFIAGGITVSSLYALTRYAYKYIEDLHILEDKELIFILFTIILIAGMLLAVISTYRAISKYLKMSLDDLY